MNRSYLHDYTLIVVDVETSGLCPKTHSLLEVAFVPVDGRVQPISGFVCPNKKDAPVDWQETASAMFSARFDDWTVKAIPYDAAYQRLNKWFGDFGVDRPVMLIGHNVGFDMSFLKQLAFQDGDLPHNVSHRCIDTHTLAMAVYMREGKAMPNGLTALLADNGVVVAEGDRHTALGDAVATRSLYLRLMERLEGRGEVARF